MIRFLRFLQIMRCTLVCQYRQSGANDNDRYSFVFCMGGMWISDVLDLVTSFQGWFVNLGRPEQCLLFVWGLLVMLCKHISDRKCEFDTLNLTESV